MASEKIYKRILLKLSGEALTGDEAFGIDPADKRRLFRDKLELMRRAWRGEAIVDSDNGAHLGFVQHDAWCAASCSSQDATQL